MIDKIEGIIPGFIIMNNRSDAEKVAADMLAVEIGKRISGKIICPDCHEEGEFLSDQEIVSVGDMENILFCPHYDMEFEIVIKKLPYERHWKK